ncbi:MAG: RNA-directed DNA polymerase [Parcubacteria group bacterium GW2011_GWA1_47_8]|nr:hypothetical protein [uncultured bacterium]KKU81471.1 MAG: RNA-directed DNA polymerase [Parcubacteria group bacterium GW2011_GWA1_47_8]
MPQHIHDFNLENEWWEICGCTGGGEHKGKYTIRNVCYARSFEEIISYESLLRAWEDFVKGKRKRVDVNDFARTLLDNLWQLHFDLKNNTYVHGGYLEYVICDPKKRMIHKASVRDRVVHRVIYNALYRYFDKRFVHDSYSSRKGKGMHKARDRFKYFVRKVSKNCTKQCFVLKFDIQKCFASIDQKVLLCLLRRNIADDKLFDIAKNIVESFGCGLPLGNFTSQLFINVYLHELDLFCKQELHIKYYLRYADDVVVVSNDEYELEVIHKRIADFLLRKLFLITHKKSITTISHGVDVLGVIFFPRYGILRKRTRVKMALRNLAAEPMGEGRNVEF